MIEWFATHKAVALIGMALVAAAAIMFLRKPKPSYANGVPVDPYAAGQPSSGAGSGGGLSVAAEGAVPPFGPGPNTSAPTSTGPGAGPTVASPVINDGGPNIPAPIPATFVTAPVPEPVAAAPVLAPMSPVFTSTPVAPAFGTVGDQPAFQAAVPSYNPIYSDVTVGAAPVAIVGVSGTTADAPNPYQPGAQASRGAAVLVDPSGHVVNAKGARVGGRTFDT